MICVGFTTELVKNWEDYVEPVMAPRNYKDLVKIADYVAQHKATAAEDALDNPVTARLGSVCLLEPRRDDSKIPIRIPIPKDTTLLEVLTKHSTIVGIRLSKLLRLAVLDHLDRGPMSVEHQWALRHDDLPVNSLALVDPVRLLVGASREDKIKLSALSTRYAIELSLSGDASNEAEVRATKLAMLALRLAERMGIR